MNRRQLARTQQAHPVEVRRGYERVLTGSSMRSRHVEVGAGGRVHLLEKGAGPPVVLLHGTGSTSQAITTARVRSHGWTAFSTPWSWTPPRRRPELIDLLVAVGRDPDADRAAKTEIRALVSPFALLTPSGFRPRSRVRPDELRQVAMRPGVRLRETRSHPDRTMAATRS